MLILTQLVLILAQLVLISTQLVLILAQLVLISTQFVLISTKFGLRVTQGNPKHVGVEGRVVGVDFCVCFYILVFVLATRLYHNILDIVD